MTLPLTGFVLLPLGTLFGLAFGWLLFRARVADANVIVNQFRLRDFTVLKVMLTAIIVGGIGVWLLHSAGASAYHIKPAYLLGVSLGAALFGVGMVVSGYCPGTALAAMGSGSVHALIAVAGMAAGAIVYALAFGWIKETLLPIGALGAVRLPELTGIPDPLWFGGLVALAIGVFGALERRASRH